MENNEQAIWSVDLDYYLERYALTEAKQAVSESSYGVGGLLINLKTKEIIHQMHNTVIARNNSSERLRLSDPTAHGERQLVDWYYANKSAKKLPEPSDILIITTLDPCCMCTGSILSAGFKVIVAALDDQAGINWDNTCSFKPFANAELQKIKQSFIYPVIEGDPKRKAFGTVPVFNQKSLLKTNVDSCFKTFVDGANVARNIINDIVDLKDSKDIKNLEKTTPTSSIITTLKNVYPGALKYRAAEPGKPDKGLAEYLVKAAKEDKANGGDGDAVAFLDCFGNLLMCKGGKKSLSPIRTAYMETIRAYQKIRYDLSTYSKDALCYLSEPKFGSFIFVKGFDCGTQSFADLGAYGSTILGTLSNDNNLQYITPRIPQRVLDSFISEMPPRYRSLIKPRRVADNDLIKAVESALM